MLDTLVLQGGDPAAEGFRKLLRIFAPGFRDFRSRTRFTDFLVKDVMEGAWRDWAASQGVSRTRTIRPCQIEA